MKIRNQKITLEQTLFASILDRLSLLCWLNSEDGQNNKNRPKSILSMLNGEKENDNEDLEVFDSVEDFERELQRLKEEAQKHE